MPWGESQGYGMNKVLILGLIKGKAMKQSGWWLIQAIEDQELRLRSVGDPNES